MQKLSDLQIQSWKLEQLKLNSGKICPFCNKIIFRQFNSHLIKYHNITSEDLYCLIYGIKKYQHKCKICDNNVYFDFGHMYYKTYCSRKCQAIDRTALIGSNMAFNLTNEQRMKRHLEDDIDYKKWQDKQYKTLFPFKSHAGKIDGVVTSQKYGSNFSYNLSESQRISRNLSTDYLYLEWQKQQKEKLNKHKSRAGKIGGKQLQKLYGCSLIGIGYRSNILFNDRQFHFDSQCELFNFLTKIYIDNIPISNISNDQYLENKTKQFNGSGAYTDLIVNSDISGLINYEVHDINDLCAIERKKYCSELNGFKFIIEDINDYTYPFGKNVQQLSLIGLNVDKLYSELTNIHYNSHSPLNIKYDELSIIYFQ